MSFRLLTALLLATAVARAELPIETPVTEPESNGVPRGIVVPGPNRPGTTGTNTAPEQPAVRPEPQPQFNAVMPNWKLVPRPQPTEDRLALRNADTLQGRFIGLDATALGWEMPGVPGLIRFRRDGLHALQLRPLDPGPTAPTAPARWVVRLTTGNLVQGSEIAVDTNAVVLRTACAGPLRLPREMVSTIYQDTAPAGSSFRVIQNVETWDQIQAGQGEFTDQQFFRDVSLPDAVLIEFEVANRQNRSLQIHLPLSAPKFLYAEPHVLCTVMGNQLTLQPTGENIMFGGAEAVALPTNRAGRWRIGLGICRSQAKATVYVDGKLMRTVQLGAPLLARSKGIAVLAQGDVNTEALVRTLVLSPIGEDLTLPAAKPDQDILRLGNGDAMAGQLVSIDATKAICTGPFGRVEMPLERIVAVMFATANAAQPRRREGDVTVQLADGGNMTAELKEFAPTGLTLASDLFGQIKVERAAVRGIRFGLYLPPPKQLSMNPWDPAVQLREFEPGQIRLGSGVTLSGNLTALANGLIGWQHPLGLAPISFSQTNVVYVNPAVTTTATNLPPLASTVQLTNGDLFRGEVVALDNQQLQLRTMFTSPLSIARRYVSTLFPNLPPEGVLDAGSIERWAVAPPTNRRGQRAEVLHRQYLRNQKLPDRLGFQMELVGQPGQWVVNAWIFGRLDGQNPNAIRTAYGLQINDNNLMLHETSQDGQYHQPTTVEIPGLSASGHVRLTWLADRVKKEEFILINGKLVAQRRNIKVAVPGDAIQVTVQNRHICQIRDVVLQEWKGRVEDLLAASPAGERVQLHDWSSLPGPVEGIREGQAILPRAQSVALGKVVSIHFDPANLARARRTKADVRVTLADGDNITLNSPLIDPRGLVGTAEGLGTVVINAGTIRRLHFRPYDPPKKADRTRHRGIYDGAFFE